MEISSFELIFKPQSPAAPTGTPNVERVIQGYFLSITNLETVEYQYGLEFVVPPQTGANAAFRTPAGNTLVFVDSGSGDNDAGVLSGAASATVFRPSVGNIRVPGQATALVAVLPSVFGPGIDPTPITTPVFETRGFVRIRLPTVRRGLGQFGLRVAQSSGPVRVLVTPQQRASFLSAGGTVTSQIQATLPAVNGSGLLSLPPDQPFQFDPGVFQPVVIGSGRPFAALDVLEPAERAAALVELMAEVPAGAAMEALNAALVAAKIPMAVAPTRKGR